MQSVPSSPMRSFSPSVKMASSMGGGDVAFQEGMGQNMSATALRPGSDMTWFQGLRMMFYLITPNESSFATPGEVPDYLDKAVPYFLIFMAVEAVILSLQGKTFRINDAIGSMSQGLFMIMSKVIYGVVEFAIYLWAYEHFHLWDLPWDSPWTWCLCFLGYDMGYYFFHRYAHEINLFWAAHQVHHSSEEYNLSTALRQSSTQGLTSWMFYVPLSVAIPPSVYMVHRQFNLIYQFWIHTEVVDRLGPLEWILNTPSHHRVHHGRNPYCIDKNYGGTLIIFDRIFGTFAPEGDPISYGLVHPVDSFNTSYVQFFLYVDIFKKAWKTQGVANKFKAVFYGPGWVEGGPRMGDPSQLPEVIFPVTKYDPPVPWWASIYCFVQFFVVLFSFQHMAKLESSMPYLAALGMVLFFMYSLTCFGMIFDHFQWAPVLELLRLSLLFVADVVTTRAATDLHLSDSKTWILRTILMVSITVWGYIVLLQVAGWKGKVKTK